MGFLDPRERILDVVLTEEGRRQYALGELRFVSFAAFDDLVDHDPWTSITGSDEYLRDLLESTPMLEAPVVPRVSSLEGPLVPSGRLFTAAGGYIRIPQVEVSTGSLDVQVGQSVKEGTIPTYFRTDPTDAFLSLSLVGDDEPGSQGYSVVLLEEHVSGTWTEVSPLLDIAGRLSYGPFVVAVPDPPPPTLSVKSRG